jgi:hypothetical protein
VLAAGGCAGAAASILTAPVAVTGTPDPMDSPYLAVAILALVPLTAVAGWCIPQAAPWWGIVATGPHHLAFIVLVVVSAAEGLNPALAPIGFMTLVVLSLPPWAAGVAGAVLRGRWQRHGDRGTP